MEPEIEIVGKLQEVKESVTWLSSNTQPDLIFMDIQLADGFSFDIFQEVTIESSVIFATAYDQYALKAFKVKGLDYLLKPIDENELRQSMQRYKEIQSHKKVDLSQLTELFQSRQKSYKDRFLIKHAEQISFIRTPDIAYFLSEESYTFLVGKSGKRYIIDGTLDQITDQLNPSDFFRINRKIIVSIDAISSVQNYFNNRLKVILNPAEKEDVLVSRNRVKDFKDWLDFSGS
jgi:DNA-binding LytR/AlgR family response regulator